jgi:catechol 2,3-dioxygenase-like lactoylglutathione lyase family enzyme
MKARFKSAWGYQGNNLKLPVGNLDAAIPFYEKVMGFRVVSRSDSPHRSAILGRDGIQIGLAESGGDPTQDGCAFEVENVEAAFGELKATGTVHGSFPPRALRHVQQWAALHKDELLANWDLARDGKPLNRIAPLE